MNDPGTYTGPSMSQAFVDWLAEHDAKVEAAVGEKVVEAIEKHRTGIGSNIHSNDFDHGLAIAERIIRQVTGGDR